MGTVSYTHLDVYKRQDPYSSGMHDAFVTEAQEKGLEIVSDEAFTADSNKDFTVQIQKAQSAGAELVFLPIYYTCLLYTSRCV